jgi:hypothetical protein
MKIQTRLMKREVNLNKKKSIGKDERQKLILDDKGLLNFINGLFIAYFDENIHIDNNDVKRLILKLVNENQKLKSELKGYKGTLEIYENPKFKKSLDKALKQKAIIPLKLKKSRKVKL